MGILVLLKHAMSHGRKPSKSWDKTNEKWRNLVWNCEHLNYYSKYITEKRYNVCLSKIL